ncbi:hypothetical protein [Paeniglutamicibacter cryotolerans]|uniref:DUF1648 domain-containing protein n=1 Tax=Paeniglutamicibacter cryotolerans TaxID=670079 RepID=A0A839QTC0_9MICC|nr:hypothetical protein [Paeniglutamicibacter cryotolerans]
MPEPARTETNTRALPLLMIAPACSILLVAVIYLWLSPLIPSRIAIHVDPDGVGYGSSLLMIAGACVIAAAAFVIGAATTREFSKAGHWFQIQKSIAVGIMALGYGAIGVALATIITTVGVDPEPVPGNSVGIGLFGFLLLFTTAACVYAAVFPRAKFESLDTTYPYN